MSAPHVPSDDDLRAFLLGTLPTDRDGAVRAWLDADPSHAARLDDLVPRGSSGIGPTVRRVTRRVSAESDDAPEPDDTPPRDGASTIPQFGAPVVEPPPAWPPAQLGAYRVVGEIGRGGMGVVLELVDDALDRRVAAKVLGPHLTGRPDAIARFLREARAAAAVEHDNVVPILHVGVDGGAPYIVMPLLKGESLNARLRRAGTLSAADVVRIGREVAAGLGAAHVRGLVHRDMKPANVWLDADTGRARVLDFGLARHSDGTDAMTESGVLQGTPAYMAPEQIDGLPTDARTDLFALGAILYESATGRHAFPGATTTAILKAVATHDPEPPAAVNSAVSPELSALVMRLLAKAPTARPASAAEVADALAAVPVPGPAAGTTVVRPASTPKPASRSRRAVWWAGARRWWC